MIRHFDMYKKNPPLNRCLIIFLLAILSPLLSLAEIKKTGVPPVSNFSKNDYHAGGQNWSIVQDLNGFIYAANSEGVLVYDGIEWQLHPLPNSSTPRSLMVDSKGNIYVGAYNDFGKVVFDEDGRFKFQSLKDKLPEQYRNFDDIWTIFPIGESILFQSYDYAYILSPDSTFSVLKAPSRFNYAFMVYDKIYLNDLSSGLMEYDGKQLARLKGCESLIGEEIRSVEPYYLGKKLLIGTQNKGLFLFDGFNLTPWNIPANNFLKENQIFCSTMSGDGYYVFGTIQNGILIIDNLGNEIQHVDRKKGIQNNTVLSVFADRDQNIWMGLDNGVSYLQANSPITFIQEGGSIGAGYTTVIHNNMLYVGTNQGLFVKPWQNGNSREPFRLIAGTSGQVWHLGVYDNQLLCGHNKGTFVIDGEQAIQIDSTPGIWKFHKMRRFPDYLIAGTYSGMIAFKRVGDSWKFERKIVGFNESFRVFEEDEEGSLWMSHGFKGVYRIDFGSRIDTIKSFRYFTTADGLPSNYNLNVVKIGKRIAIASHFGMYEYSSELKTFRISAHFSTLFREAKEIAMLKEDRFGNVWYINRKFELGVFKLKESGEYQFTQTPFELLAGKFISGFADIYAYSRKHYFLNLDIGFAHYNSQSPIQPEKDFRAYIRKASATNIDSTFYLGKETITDKEVNRHYKFPHARNGFKFWFASPLFENEGKILFSYRLDGYDENWSDWNNGANVEFTNLPEGEYVFRVKARDMAGHESIEDALTFYVKPPWYRSVIAYFVYMFIFLGIIFLASWLFFKRIEISRRKERLKHLLSYRHKEQEYKRKALVAEKQIVSLNNEKLRTEMIHRDKELANQTMDLIRKNKFMGKIKDDLQKIQDNLSDESLKEKIAVLIKKIDKDIDSEKQWEVFESAFDEVHEDFLMRLKNSYPQLTPKELRLCAYLRMNISTKEIAPLMNISVRGVEICRYRVRKKLNIDRDTNMTKLIMEL